MRSQPSAAPARAIQRYLLSLPVALGVVVALAAGANAGAQAASRPHATAPNAADVTPAAGPGAVPRTASSRAGTWRLLPRAPLTQSPGQMAAVWTGHEMIIHAIYFRSIGGIRGVTVAYRRATGTWVRLANGPSRSSAFETTDVAVWTGSRMLVPGQTSAIYDPATNTWSQMPLAPMPLSGAVTGWTGHQFLAWAGTCCEDNSHDGYAYNPASNTWRKLPTAPLTVRRDASGTWTGRELVVAGGVQISLPGPSTYFRDAAAYNPATGKWRTIAPMPRREAGATAVWDGKEILFIGGTGPKGLFNHGLAYNPATNRWRLLPAMAYPRTGLVAVWTGRQVLVWGGLTASRIPPPHGEVYTPGSNKWAALPASPLRGRADPVAVWTGRQMIVWVAAASPTEPSTRRPRKGLPRTRPAHPGAAPAGHRRERYAVGEV